MYIESKHKEKWNENRMKKEMNKNTRLI